VVNIKKKIPKRKRPIQKLKKKRYLQDKQQKQQEKKRATIDFNISLSFT
tara:strand:+ start:180 stop:326 length:147 start_codon:yes stop_codon:yes gene_type:complete